MNKIKQLFILFLILFLIPFANLNAQIYINEICPSNVNVITNSDGNSDDWLELFNAGNTNIDLFGYGLSDDSTKAYAFTFPHVNINARGYLIVFASGENNTDLVNHWETAVKASSNWKYLP